MNAEKKRGDEMERETFKGKRVIVTGGSRGIGEGIVRAFAGEGAKVALLYHAADAAAETVSRETGAIAIKCDLADAVDAERATREAVGALSGVDILVNNAGICQSGLIQDLSLDDWNRLIAVDLTAVFLCTRAVVPTMVRQKYGRIVNISSIWGMVGASCEAGYSAAKAGVIGFSKALAQELGPSGITVNCVCPGWVKTPMQDREIVWEGAMKGITPEEVRQSYIDHTPLGRLCYPEDVANAVAFFVLPESDFITGEAMNVSGGANL